MEIEPIAFFHSPLSEKFGIPRQSGLAPSLRGYIEFVKGFRTEDAIRGIEGFDYLWLIWGFSLNRRNSSGTTVRPPRLGGNDRVGVFASRSPFRPNPLGLSSVKIESVDFSDCIIHVSGADLADGTPVYDIKPYVEYTDSHIGVRSGFVDANEWKTLKVNFPEKLRNGFSEREIDVLEELLSQNPRPGYQDDPQRIYGLRFAQKNIRFRIEADEVTVLDV